MAGKKFYAVKKGKVPGVYTTWDACRRMVHGFPGAVYKSFPTREEAETFAGITEAAVLPDGNGAAEKTASAAVEVLAPDNAVNYAFVDGSFNSAAKVYGYGGFLVTGGQRYVISGSGRDPQMASMRNVAGEVLGSMAAVRKALELGLHDLTVYYDYMGIEMWATGAWKRNKQGTIAYYDFMQSVKDQISLHFVKVKGHSGIEGNEEADRLARKASGVD